MAPSEILVDPYSSSWAKWVAIQIRLTWPLWSARMAIELYYFSGVQLSQLRSNLAKQSVSSFLLPLSLVWPSLVPRCPLSKAPKMADQLCMSWDAFSNTMDIHQNAQLGHSRLLRMTIEGQEIWRRECRCLAYYASFKFRLTKVIGSRRALARSVEDILSMNKTQSDSQCCLAIRARLEQKYSRMTRIFPTRIDRHGRRVWVSYRLLVGLTSLTITLSCSTNSLNFQASRMSWLAFENLQACCRFPLQTHKLSTTTSEAHKSR